MSRVLLELLFTTWTNVNERDRHGWAPLHILAQNRSNEEEKTNMIAALLDSGADVNLKGNRGATPLFKAASTAAISQARELLAWGADPNEPNDDGATPLDATWANRECRRLILRKGGRKGAGVTGKGRSESDAQGGSQLRGEALGTLGPRGGGRAAESPEGVGGAARSLGPRGAGRGTA